MKINNQEVTINDLKDFIPSKIDELKKRKANIVLRDSQIEILIRNGIDYNNFSDLKSLLFEIEDILSDEENEELELVADEISEIIYYYYTNK